MKNFPNHDVLMHELERTKLLYKRGILTPKEVVHAYRTTDMFDEMGNKCDKVLLKAWMDFIMCNPDIEDELE